MPDRVKPASYRLSYSPEIVVELPWESAVSASDPDYQQWLAEGNFPQPADPPPQTAPDWDGLWNDLIDPAKLLPLFQRIKAVAKTDLGVNASFTVLIPTIATTKSEPALAAAIQELSMDLINARESLTQEEETLWNWALEARGFSDAAKL